MRHLGQVLVGRRGGVLCGRVHRLAVGTRLIVGNLFLAAAAVAGQRVGGQGVVGGQDAACDERVNERAEAACVAARDGDAGRFRDRPAPPGAQLGEAVDPARRGAVCGRRVDDAHAAVGHCGGLARGIVGQTEDGDVGLVDVRAAGCGILAFFFAYGKQLDVRPCGKPLCDPQARSCRRSRL